MINQTEFLFRDDAYLREARAVVTGLTDMGGVVLDRTVFYANSGGQPGDSGHLDVGDGHILEIATAVHPDGDKTAIVHVPTPGQDIPAVGTQVMVHLDWPRRYRLMRMHTALHLLSVVFPFPVTGGSIGADKGRLDFDMPEVPDNLEELEAQMNWFVAENHDVADEWISEEELDAKPELVKTMKVKPPRGQGRIRLVRIGAGDALVDLQPCGGTHVRSTGEIGALRIAKIEKKGRENRRVNLVFDQLSQE